MDGERVIKVIHSIKEMQLHAESLRQQGRTIAFVPTMGFLHEGHLSLLKEGRQQADILVLSIFVNPTQFAPNEDFDAYPRDFQRDADLSREAGVDIIFNPDRNDLYPDGFQTHVSLEKLPHHLCGISRPTFFRGVATIVTKLFHIVMPHVSIFGEKDFQQLAVIRRMVRDLNLDIRIVGGPTIREADGLAMSSRNAYLKAEQRETALCLNRALTDARERVKKGEVNTARIIDAATAAIDAFPDTQIDYIAVVDVETLESIPRIDRPSRMVLAVKVGTTRLIDNMALNP